MRIISWNCRKGGYRHKNKESPLLKYKPDIAVIQECENIDKQDSKNIWIGDSPKGNGIGLFSYSNYTFEIHEDYNPSFKYVVPIKVKGKNNFLLFAVWTKLVGQRQNSYIEQVWFAMNHYKHLLNKPTIIIGDFNWWVDDKPDLFTELINLLNENGIKSTYHSYFKEAFGKETIKTQFHPSMKKSYHIDYCFVSSEFLAKLKRVEVGKYEDWSRYSDHKPIIIDFKDINKH